MLKANELSYEKIQRYLNDLISKGELKEGDRILPEREIAKMFKVSKIPVRRAMKPFIDNGVLEKIHGRGTFVKKTREQKKATDRLAILYCHSQAGLFASSFYMQIITGIEGQALQEKMTIMLRSLVRDKNEAPALAIEELTDEVDGFLLLDPTPDIYEQLEATLLACHKPVVILNNESISGDLDAVVPDSARDTRAAVQFLIDQGHRKIAAASGCSFHRGAVSANFRNRIRYFREVMQENNLPVADNQELMFRHNKTPSDSTLIDPASLKLYSNFDNDIELFNGMFEGPDPVTALFCCGDDLAMFAYKLAYHAGISIPDDLSIIGYADTIEASQVHPKLTTIHTPLQDMGALAVTRIRGKMKEKKQGLHTHYRITVPGKLMKRESHKKIDGNNEQAIRRNP